MATLITGNTMSQDFSSGATSGVIEIEYQPVDGFPSQWHEAFFRAFPNNSDHT